MQRRNARAARQTGQRARQAVAHGVAIGAGPREKPRAGDGRERHAGLQLRVITPARVLIGLRPAVVENIFALAVAFGVERHGAGENARFVARDQVMRRPAGARAHAARIFQRRQEGVAEERIVGACARIPFGGRDRVQAFDRVDLQRWRAIGHGR